MQAVHCCDIWYLRQREWQALDETFECSNPSPSRQPPSLEGGLRAVTLRPLCHDRKFIGDGPPLIGTQECLARVVAPSREEIEPVGVSPAFRGDLCLRSHVFACADALLEHLLDPFTRQQEVRHAPKIITRS